MATATGAFARALVEITIGFAILVLAFVTALAIERLL
jgi:hypothetical protein